jgi:hypothetical protein
MATYTERAWNVSDEAEIARLKQYIADLKAQLAAVRGEDPVEFWWDEMARIQRQIDAILGVQPTELSREDQVQLDALRLQLDGVLEELDAAEAERLAIIEQGGDTTAIDAEIAALEAQKADLESQIEAILAHPGVAGRTPEQNAQLEALQAQLEEAIQRYRLAREPKRNGIPMNDPAAFIEITGDVVWAQTEFTQMAKTGPGSFRITLKGDHPEFRAGEEIHLEVDDLRVFGGWVTGVERGYFFDAAVAPKTVLVGTDYNILFDRLVMRNYGAELTAGEELICGLWSTGTKPMMGAYHNWPTFPEGVLDSEIIGTVMRYYMLPDLPMAFDYTSGVETVDTPAPVAPWALPEAGSALRRLFQSISQITSAVWYIDAYMVLRYHDRSTINAPYPVTDGLGGISSRDMTVTTDISSMTNDVLVWGTLAETVSGEIMVWHEIGDLGYWERYWIGRVERYQRLLSNLYAIAPSRRTTAQKNAITAYTASLADAKANLADVRARAWDPLSGDPRPDDALVASVATWGRWQTGEFREDIHHPEWLRMRSHAILTRFDEPIIRASATIWDPGYQAGMVTRVRSAEHGLDQNLVIRQMGIDFSVAKEPHDGKYYALPRYRLELGLEPEAPWNIYDYLPYPGETTPGLGTDNTGG